MSLETDKAVKLDAGTELSSHRTALSIARTQMSADRTQMSILRTSLSLIGFGFTIFKVFQELGRSLGKAEAFSHPSRNFGISLVVLGVALLIAGLFHRSRTMRALAHRQQILFDEGLLPMPPEHQISPNVIVSVLLLIGGIMVLFGIIVRVGPFS